MAHTASQLAALPNRRVGSLIAPREHGAWGLLLVPLFTGGITGLFAGGNILPLVALTVAAVTLFWLRTPVESWLGAGIVHAQTPEERRSVAFTIGILIVVVMLSLGSLFWNGQNGKLVWLGVLAICAFLGQSFLRRLSRQTRMLSQIVGTLGLTVTAPAAYYVVSGQLSREAWSLWITNFLFAVNQIHYVQLRIHGARLSGWREKFEHGRAFLLGEALLATVLLAAWRFHLLPWLAAMAFLPLLLRGAAWLFEGQKALAMRRLGWTELAYAIVFGVCLIAGFHLGR